VPTACSILGISRAHGYELVRQNRFPVKVLRAGRRIVVPVAPLLQIVGLGAPDQALTDLERMADRIADRLADRLLARLAGRD
jgi:hypothetical protein